MPAISLCMIVKNEEEVLARCLSSVRPLVDEIIIVDTGSTDNTIAIARGFGAVIEHFDWIDDFGAARNYSFSKATSPYIIWLDADDVILPSDLERLLELKERLHKDVYMLLYDYSQDASGNTLCTLYRERIVRREADIRWQYPIHECMITSTANTSERVDITITHRRTHAGAAADENRNLRILEKAVAGDRYRNDARICYYLGKEYLDAGREEPAIAEFRRFLAMPDGWIEDRIGAQQRIAKGYYNLSRKDPLRATEYRSQARAEAKLARAMDSRWAEPHFILGSIAFDEEDYEEAIFWYELCLRPAPDVLSPLDSYTYGVGPLVQICISHDRLGDHITANEYNEHALAMMPNDRNLLANRDYFAAVLERQRTGQRTQPTGIVKLNLGSGNKRYLDYRNCDKYPGREVDETFSLDDIPYDDETVDAIHSEHALEHLYHESARTALREWYRVLKPGGTVLLKLPDLGDCCRAFLAAATQEERDWYRYTIYGIQRSLGDEPMEGQIHHTGFTREELVREMEQIGFVVDASGNYDGYSTPSVEVQAHKPVPDTSADIVIPTCANPEYLQACVRSIIACTEHPHRIIVVNSGGPRQTAGLPESVLVIESERRLNFSEAVNVGIRAGSSPFIVILNDDVIVSHGWLEAMIAEAEGNVGIVNPLSNCDKGWLHDYHMEVDGMELLPGMNRLFEGTLQLRWVDEPGIAPERIYTAHMERDRVYRRDWVAFYCTLVRRDVVRMTGLLDEEFVNGSEDLDYCLRARKMGFECAVTERSFVFHFGGTSRAARELEMPEAFRAEDRSNMERAALKHDRPLLVIHTGSSYEPWTSATIGSAGIGGSETAAARMAEELARLGYRVVVFSSCDGMEGRYNSVEYLDYARFERFIDAHVIDVMIVSRYMFVLQNPLRVKKLYLWVHDIYAMGTELGERDLVPFFYERLDGIFCLSPWHIRNFCSIHGVPADKLILTGNGIDPERFERHVERRTNRFIYSSSPDRGLDTLLGIFPLIRELLPDAELHVFYGFDNWDKAIEMSQDAGARALRDLIHRRMSQPGVFYHGRVGQEQLAEEYLRSDVWFYPTSFTETYCITALEAQMAGTLCVCTDLAGLSSTIADRGILLGGDARSAEFVAEAVRRLLVLLRDPEAKEAMRARARAWAVEQTWYNRAREWEAIFRTPGIVL
ncbi:MAG: glycosyltransferase [Bacteroidetes bacterium]|nr:glycosyltransferase [Bacteroidota bacterium]